VVADHIGRLAAKQVTELVAVEEKIKALAKESRPWSSPAVPR
jgi:hypothetical protein